jgi:putative Mg2+ transporter-C (MgtC) family protein
MTLPDISMPLTIPWLTLGHYLLKTLVAFLLALPIAWEREQTTHRVGLRTFPLVAVASCGYVLMSVAVVGSDADPQARIIQGLMTGMGFIGGGAILREDGMVRGTSTAASIWTTGIIGASVAYEYYAIAVIVSIINYVTFRTLTPVVHSIDRREQAEQEGEQAEQRAASHPSDNNSKNDSCNVSRST